MDGKREAEIVVWDARRDVVLVGDDGGLPRVVFETAWPPLDHRLCERVAQVFGLRAVVLEVLDFVTVVLELVADAAAPYGFGWRERDAAGSLGPVYDGWAARRVDRRARWFLPGWYGRACDIIEEQVAKHGGEVTGPAVQIKHWSLSSVLRAPTTLGDVYLKTVLPRLVHEPDIIGLLARRWPRAVPEVLAHCAAEDWWLAADFGGTIGWDLPEDARAGALPVLVEMQQALTGRADELSEVGCTARPPDVLADQFSVLFEREDLWTAPRELRNLHRALLPEEYERLRAVVPFLRECCDGLAAGPVADTLMHGDFFDGNTAARPGGFLIYDWGFVSVAHPLLDLATWLYDATEATAASHVDSYLRCWDGVVAREELERCWRLARPVGAAVEAAKFATLADRVGQDYDFNWLPVMYGWARKLLYATGDGASLTGFRR